MSEGSVFNHEMKLEQDRFNNSLIDAIKGIGNGVGGGSSGGNGGRGGNGGDKGLLMFAGAMLGALGKSMMGIAISAIPAAIILVVQRWAKIVKLTKSLGLKIFKAVDRLTGMRLGVALTNVGDTFKKLVDGLKKVGESIKKVTLKIKLKVAQLGTFFTNMTASTRAAAGRAGTAITGWMDKIKLMFDDLKNSKVGKGIVKQYNSAMAGIKGVASWIKTQFAGIRLAGGPISNAFSRIGPIMSKIGEFATGLWNKVKALRPLFGRLLPLMGKILVPLTWIIALWKGGTRAWEGLKEGDIEGALKGFITGLFEGLVGDLTNMIFDVGGWIAGKLGFENVKVWLQDVDVNQLFAKWVDIVSGMVTGLSEWITTNLSWSGIKDAAISTWNGMMDVGSMIGDIFQPFIDFVIEIPGRLADWLRDLIPSGEDIKKMLSERAAGFRDSMLSMDWLPWGNDDENKLTQQDRRALRHGAASSDIQPGNNQNGSAAAAAVGAAAAPIVMYQLVDTGPGPRNVVPPAPTSSSTVTTQNYIMNPGMDHPDTIPGATLRSPD
jgi:hypothetical protein